MKRPICISGAELCNCKMSGIPRYMHEIIIYIDKALNDWTEEEDIRVCYPKGKTVMLPQLDNIKTVEITLPDGKNWNTGVFREYVNSVNGIFCGMSNNKSLNKGSIITLHDVRRLEHREYDSFKTRMLYKFQMLFIRKYSERIMTLTEYQKNAIAKKLKFDKNKIDISYCGYEHILDFAEDEDIFAGFSNIRRGEYYYAVGSVAKHKNYKWILETAKRNPEKQFVVAGLEMKNKWNTDNSDFSNDNIVYVGYVSDEENKALIKSCRAFVHPSLYEGFGIPPLEALCLGKPVFVSSATCLPEIYDGLATIFNPDDYSVNIDELFYPEPEQLRTALEKYSWKNAALRWLELFDKVNV